MIRGRWDLCFAVIVFSPGHQSITALSTQSLRNIIIIYLSIIRRTTVVLIHKCIKSAREQIIIMIETENVILFAYRLFTLLYTHLYYFSQVNDVIRFRVFYKSIQ